MNKIDIVRKVRSEKQEEQIIQIDINIVTVTREAEALLLAVYHIKKAFDKLGIVDIPKRREVHQLAIILMGVEPDDVKTLFKINDINRLDESKKLVDAIKTILDKYPGIFDKAGTGNILKKGTPKFAIENNFEWLWTEFARLGVRSASNSQSGFRVLSEKGNFIAELEGDRTKYFDNWTIHPEENVGEIKAYDLIIRKNGEIYEVDKQLKYDFDDSHKYENEYKDKILENFKSIVEPKVIKIKQSNNSSRNSVVSPKMDLEKIDVEKREEFLNDVFITEDEYNKLANLLIRKKNLILKGAPGVGKTFVAKRLAKSLMGDYIDKDERIELIQFHQSYSYEDFIMGYRPIESGGFELSEGVFYKFCEKARNEWEKYNEALAAEPKTTEVEPLKDFYFIIDEINRGNISKIFGETFMLVEHDKRDAHNAVKLTYSKKVKDEKGDLVTDKDGNEVFERFFIPPNVYIIGMMNTADRSLAIIDYALRRRFAFFEMQPAFENDDTSFNAYIEKINDSNIKNLFAKIKKLNVEIADDLGSGFKIGHSYFIENDKFFVGKTHEDIKVWLQEVVEYELIPLLEEYWFDDDERLNLWSVVLRESVGLTFKKQNSNEADGGSDEK